VYFCVATDISAAVQRIDAKFCTVVDMSSDRSSPRRGVPQACHNIQTFDYEYHKNSKLQHYMSNGA